MVKTVARFIPSFDRQRLYCKTFQNSLRPKLHFVLVHGLGGESDAYDLVIQGLLRTVPDCRCIVYDQRGHGWSSRHYPPAVCSFFEILSQDLQAVCKFFRLNEPILLGHSLGGIVVQEYLSAAFAPAPKEVFLIASPYRLPRLSVAPNFWFRCLRAFSKTWDNSPHRRTIKDHLKHKNSWDYSIFRVTSDMKHTGYLNYCLLWSSLVGWCNKNLETLNQPYIHFIYSQKDQVVRAGEQQKMMRELSQANFNFIPTNHNSVINMPDEVVAAIVEKLSPESV